MNKSYKYGECGSFKHLLFLFCFVLSSMISTDHA